MNSFGSDGRVVRLHQIEEIAPDVRKRLFLAVWTKSGLCGLGPYVSTIDSSGHDRSEEVCVSCGERSLRRHRHR
jgi:hypothetical protein